MKKFIRFSKVFLTDAVAVICLFAALLTGWLPGPGGLPLFLLGLGLLSINHDWAKRYIDLVKEYGSRLSEFIFVDYKWVQNLYDGLTLLLILLATYILLPPNRPWQYSLGIFFGFMGLTIFFGNRRRWLLLKARLKHKR